MNVLLEETGIGCRAAGRIHPVVRLAKLKKHAIKGAANQHQPISITSQRFEQLDAETRKEPETKIKKNIKQ